MSKDEYLLTDTPLKALTVFAMPMILGSFFQQIYNMADSIIVGQFVGSSALAAVGACAALTNVFICVALGAGVGAGVLVSRYFGAKEYGKMKTIVSTSLLSFLILSIVLGIFGLCFSLPMMRGLQTPPDILDEAVLYLRVYFAGFPFLFMYNILSNMFTSIGESRIPLALLIFSSVLNIFMDLWMVAGLGLGVFGAALATLIAQGISAIFSFLIFLHRMRRYESPIQRFDWQGLQSMLQIAVPSILQQSTVSIGMLIVQDQVWNRVTINRAQHKATRYYMDEFHLLLKEEQTAAYSVEIWKRFRKWGGIPTGITQNVKDLLASREVENIFENSDFVYLLNQASGDRQILSKALNISPSQQNYITNSNAGEGLIFYGSTIVPFKDDFPKDTQLYRIMTTRLEETVQN